MRALRLATLMAVAACLLLKFDLWRCRRGGQLTLAPVVLRPSLIHFGASAGEVIHAVDTVAALYWKQVRCLQRSVCLVRLLRSIEIPANLVVGYRTRPFMSHAWVTVNGVVVNESPRYARTLQTMLVA